MPKKLRDIRSNEPVTLPADVENISTGGILSDPPTDGRRIVNVYVKDNKLEIKYDDTDNTGAVIESNPEVNGYQVVNMYVDSITGRLTVKYNQE